MKFISYLYYIQDNTTYKQYNLPLQYRYICTQPNKGPPDTRS